MLDELGPVARQIHEVGQKSYPYGDLPVFGRCLRMA